MTDALARARKEAQGSGNERARAWAAVAAAEALERIAGAQETQAAIARHYLDESGGEFDFEGPRTAEVRSPLLMDVGEGGDDGQWHEVKFCMQGPLRDLRGEEESAVVMIQHLAAGLMTDGATFYVDAISIKPVVR